MIFNNIFPSIFMFRYCLEFLANFIEDKLAVLIDFGYTVEDIPCLWRSKKGIIWSGFKNINYCLQLYPRQSISVSASSPCASCWIPKKPSLWSLGTNLLMNPSLTSTKPSFPLLKFVPPPYHYILLLCYGL